MLVHHMDNLPKVGDYVTMANSITGELERLKAVLTQDDDEAPGNIKHVFFASGEVSDNEQQEQMLDGTTIQYYCIRTYMNL